jgi:hypothetical protein
MALQRNVGCQTESASSLGSLAETPLRRILEMDGHEAVPPYTRSRSAKPEPAASASAPGMVLRVQIFHSFTRHMGVDLGGGQVAVAEQHLHHAQIGSVIQ